MNSRKGRLEPKLLIVDAMSGGNDFASTLITELAMARQSTTVFTVEDTRLRKAPGLDLLPYWPRFGGGSSPKIMLRMLRAVLRLIGEVWTHRRGCIHMQFPRIFIAECLVILLLRPFVSRIIVTSHNAVPHERSRVRELLLPVWFRLADEIIVLSLGVQRTIMDRHRICEDRFRLIPHGNYDYFFVSTSSCVASDDIETTLAKVGDRKLILMTGLIRHYKGVDTVIRAGALLDGNDSWAVVVAGGGSPTLVTSYLEEVNRLGLASRVFIVHHFLSDDDLSVLLRRANVLVFPYREISQSGALLLGMTFGHACVCSDQPGFREYLGENECLYFSPADDFAALASCINRLLTDPNLCESLGRAARSAALSRFGWRDITLRYLAAYSGEPVANAPAISK